MFYKTVKVFLVWFYSEINSDRKYAGWNILFIYAPKDYMSPLINISTSKNSQFKIKEILKLQSKLYMTNSINYPKERLKAKQLNLPI